MKTWKHIRAILLLPFTVTVVVPGLIVYLSGLDTRNLWQTVPVTRLLLPVMRTVFILFGLVLLIATIDLFACTGKGTLAPWNPPERIVVRGVYRHIHNPMISAVAFTLLGEALAIASLPLFSVPMAWARQMTGPLARDTGRLWTLLH